MPQKHILRLKLWRDTEGNFTNSLTNLLCPTVPPGPAVLHIPSTSVQQLEAGGRRTHRNQLTTDKVTGRRTSRLSSYLCTPSGSQRRIRWCQTGRSSRDCWMCCSAAEESLYLHYNNIQKTDKTMSCPNPTFKTTKDIWTCTTYIDLQSYAAQIIMKSFSGFFISTRAELWRESEHWGFQQQPFHLRDLAKWELLSTSAATN